jgi:hypothetical protein
MVLMPSPALVRPAWAAVTAVAVAGSLNIQLLVALRQNRTDARRVNLLDGGTGSSKSGDNLEAVNVALEAAESTLLDGS